MSLLFNQQADLSFLITNNPDVGFNMPQRPNQPNATPQEHAMAESNISSPTNSEMDDAITNEMEQENWCTLSLAKYPK